MVKQLFDNEQDGLKKLKQEEQNIMTNHRMTTIAQQ
jgi:hypothetical protein